MDDGATRCMRKVDAGFPALWEADKGSRAFTESPISLLLPLLGTGHVGTRTFLYMAKLMARRFI
jgi:hypothetical protein